MAGRPPPNNSQPSWHARRVVPLEREDEILVISGFKEEDFDTNGFHTMFAAVSSSVPIPARHR
jgi:hypothetical protein